MKIDLHVHASERSDCARVSEADQIKAARAAGLDGLAFTDHHRLASTTHLAELNQKAAPFKVFTGIEITADHEDWLVFGVNDPALESQLWDYPSLRRFVRRMGGVIILAHPYRYQPEIRADVIGLPPDGIELKSRNTPRQYEALIRGVAATLGLALLCNSDAHLRGDIGDFYNEFPGEIADDHDLVRTLLSLKPAKDF